MVGGLTYINSMVTRIVLDPKDWKILVEYLAAQPVDFTQIETAAKVKKIIESVQVMDIEVKQPENGINSSGSN